MLTSLIGLSVASFVCMMFSQTRSIGAIGMLGLIVLSPRLFLGMAAAGGLIYYLSRR